MVGADLEFGQLHDTYGTELDERYDVNVMVPNSVGGDEIVMIDD